jgi:outer membrane protein assembly factor BamB
MRYWRVKVPVSFLWLYLLVGFVSPALLLAQDSVGSARTNLPHSFVCGDYTGGRVLKVSAQNQIVWEAPAEHCNDLWALTNGNILFTTGTGVTEMTPQGKTVFRYDSQGSVYACQRLADGNTFVGECDLARLVIVNPEGKVVRTVNLLPDGARGDAGFMRNARCLTNGHFLVAHYKGKVVAEYDESGKKVWEVPVRGGPHSAIRLANGDTLVTVADSAKNPGVVEFNPAGEVVWRISNADIPGAPLKFISGVHRLVNGNTVFCNWLGHGQLGKAPHLFEVTPEKKVVWTYENPAMQALGTVQVTDEGENVVGGTVAH